MIKRSILAAVAAPFILAACQHGGQQADLRNGQLSTCAAKVAESGALAQSDFSTVYDRETPEGNAIVKVTGPTGTFDCEIDKTYQVVGITQTAAP